MASNPGSTLTGSQGDACHAEGELLMAGFYIVVRSGRRRIEKAPAEEMGVTRSAG
jgi:hypothetical protein